MMVVVMVHGLWSPTRRHPVAFDNSDLVGDKKMAHYRVVACHGVATDTIIADISYHYVVARLSNVTTVA